uniref:FLZ-type domain-containing protein n=1 Tax=Nelumbo nucifera TaxID=4432 RepID=A0A822ZMU8_NELNU|nr:TPA_asm: hypothetical protein HUJ06_004457 [Nelumbo nucifera]
MMMVETSGKKRPSINLSLFINFSELSSSDSGWKSPNSIIDCKPPTKSLRKNFEEGVVGLGIVAAMNEMNDTHDAFSSAKTSRAVKMALSPRSEPIPIVYAKPTSKHKEPISENKHEMELSESYTCVISRVGNNSIKKHEYFDKPDDTTGTQWLNSAVFFTSPPDYVEPGTAFRTADFLSSCYRCKKKLQGLDIFMYRYLKEKKRISFNKFLRVLVNYFGWCWFLND